MSTTEKRTELLVQIERVKKDITFCLEGLTYVLGSEQFDRTFHPELIPKFEETLGALDGVGSVLMDSVNTMMMELD